MPIPEAFLMSQVGDLQSENKSAIHVQQLQLGASATSSATRLEILNARGLINYATFRQKLSEESALKAQKRAEANAEAARKWNCNDKDDDHLMELGSLQHQQQHAKSLNNVEHVDPGDAEDEASSSSTEEADESLSMGSSSASTTSHCQPPSPPPRRDRATNRNAPPVIRPRSTSPGKTVTFSDETTAEDERSLNELDASPRRMKLKPLAALASLGTSLKRRAPSPPASTKVKDRSPREHEALGAKLSASLRATFGLPNNHNAYIEENGSEKSEEKESV